MHVRVLDRILLLSSEKIDLEGIEWPSGGELTGSLSVARAHQRQRVV
ncbi:hypothetical protein GCM10010520_13610 [Rhizobium viscosum]